MNAPVVVALELPTTLQDFHLMKRRRAFCLLVLMVLLLVGACGMWLRVQRQQYARNRALIAALVHKDTKTALALVNAGADPNTRYDPPPAPSFQLLLNRLVSHKSLPANNTPTAFIITCGMRENMAKRGVASPIELEGKPTLIEAMLTHGADVHVRSAWGYTALDYAVIRQQLHTVQLLLLRHGVNVNAQDKHGTTPLMWALTTGNVDVVHVLLVHGANPNIQDENGQAALHTTLFTPNTDIVIPDLLAHGADANRRDKDKVTPLELAQMLGRTDIVRLLKRGAK